MRLVLRIILWAGVLAVLALAGARLAAGWRESASVDDILPAGGRLVETAAGRVFVLEEGPADGPVLLFAHGTAAWSGLWAPVLQAMGAQGWRAVAFDQPPFGYSERAADGDYSRQAQAERILALVEAMEARPVLVAHSVGAGPGVEAVMLNSDAFAGLIVVDGALGLGLQAEDARLPLPLRSAVLAEAVTALTMTNPLLTRTFLRGFVHQKAAATDARVALLQAPFTRQGTTRAYALWLPSLLVPRREALSTQPINYAALKLPVAYIWGEQDSVTPLHQGRRLAEITPGARLFTLPGVGHIPQIEDEAAFLLVLAEALRSIRASAAED